MLCVTCPPHIILPDLIIPIMYEASHCANLFTVQLHLLISSKHVDNSKSKGNACTNHKQSEMDTAVTQAQPQLTSSISATSHTAIRRSSRMTVLARLVLP
jgi:hypothetical protein